MSWQAYVDSNLVGSGHLAKAAIFGLDGSNWASTPGFNITSAEAQELSKAFLDTTEVAANGLSLEGVKFVFLRAGDNNILARKGATGVCCAKTNQAMLIGYYNETMQAGEANIVVQGLADYLIGLNY
ncbi:profilin, required for normal timing of actin polymerization in response to thermal stress [Entomortierella beljakovae]|nr:profilin, required for normal timing of actin polymerization in response to thermal stress [Entomortierella beljakovae]